MSRATCRASPSLALVKYWGKLDRGRNTPATPSLAVTLGGLETITEVETATDTDTVTVGDAPQPAERYAAFFDGIRRALRVTTRFHAVSRNDFPTSAGLASSSSGFAALACASVWAAGGVLPERRLSELARFGSASASRAIYGGFVLLDRGATAARPVLPAEHWPELRILAVVAAEGPKTISSRVAMESSRTRSPYYPAWVRSSRALLPEALTALRTRDLERLGGIARLSAYRMHAVMLATREPVRYWTAQTLAVLEVCAELRAAGVGAWETLDAGPQVKVLCLEADSGRVEREITARLPALRVLKAWPGAGVRRP